MILDGKKLAGEILARTNVRTQNLDRRPKVLAIVANETAATKSYLAIKEKRAAEAGCVLEVAKFPESVSTDTLRLAIATAEADAIIVQLPLPVQVDSKEVCDAIPAAKDADVLSAAEREQGALLPPVVGAVAEILASAAIVPNAKKVVIIGEGFLVGKPVATWFRAQGAEVEVITLESGSLTALKDADIIVSGAGSPHLIKPEMIKEGAVLVDAGTSESSGKLMGDADPACAEKCSLFTPVPGGVGPVAVAKLFENTVLLAESKPFIS